jgi:hypothetical protein
MPTKPTSTAKPHAPRRGKKYFDVSEANRAVGYIARIMEDVHTCYRTALGTREQIEHPRPGEALDPLRADYEKAMDRLNELVDELRQTGVELKDFDKGLVDFPAVHEGREICLCWHLGEKTITKWHEIDAGFAGRQDVALLESK